MWAAPLCACVGAVYRVLFGALLYCVGALVCPDNAIAIAALCGVAALLARGFTAAVWPTVCSLSPNDSS